MPLTILSSDVEGVRAVTAVAAVKTVVIATIHAGMLSKIAKISILLSSSSKFRVYIIEPITKTFVGRHFD
jgi:hypothetical protein